MATQKQIEANRLNSQKSTGPRSAEGKASSRMNALKSGIHARSQIIYGESQTNLETLTAEYYDSYRPATPEQRMLVDTLIDAEWLLRRFRVCEAQLYEPVVQIIPRPDKGVELAQAFRKNANHFARLQRRIDSAQRNYRNALHELERLQAEAVAIPDANPDPPPPPGWAAEKNQSPAVPIGFVPQAAPQDPVDPSSANSRDPMSSGRILTKTSLTPC